MSADSAGLTNRMSSAVVSILTSFFTISILYTISTQRELWILLFVMVLVFIYGLQGLVTKCCYSREEQNDVDKLTVIRFLTILTLTVSFIIVKLITDLFTLRIATTSMLWYDYINIVGVVLFFIIVVFSRIEF